MDDKQWMEILENESYRNKLIFYKFTIIWISFNAYINRYSGRDEEKVKAFAKDKSPFFDSLKSNNNQFSEELKKFKDTKTDGRKTVKDMSKKNSYIPFNGERNTSSDYFRVIYQIRCNYMHGEKNPANEDDEKLVQWAFNTLSFFWREFLRNEAKQIQTN
jgi:hypothetical protein